MDLVSTAIVWAALFGPQGEDGAGVPSPESYRARIAFLRPGITSDEVERILGWDKWLIKPFGVTSLRCSFQDVTFGPAGGPVDAQSLLLLTYQIARDDGKHVMRLTEIVLKRRKRLEVEIPAGHVAGAEKAWIEMRSVPRSKPVTWVPFPPAVTRAGGSLIIGSSGFETRMRGGGGSTIGPHPEK